MLSSLLFCSALGAWVLSGCSAKLDGYVPMGGDTGGSSSLENTSIGGDGSSATTSPTGSTVAPAPAALSSGTTNRVSTGGYWYTYADHNPDGSQYHATAEQVTSPTKRIQPTIDSDPTHADVLRVNGTVPSQLPWANVATQEAWTIDSYWQAIYPDSRIPDYPAAGIGFGFLYPNAPFDGTGGGNWVGIAFDMKTDGDTPLVWVSMPTVDTELPDPNYSDAFPKQCQYYTSAIGHTPLDGGQTCFTHYRKAILSPAHDYQNPIVDPNTYNTLANVHEWKRYCVLYSEVAVPSYANSASLDMLAPFDPTHLLKIQWDMYQPGTGADNFTFEVSFDNVNLLTAEQAADAANNCDPAWIGAPPGTGNAG